MGPARGTIAPPLPRGGAAERGPRIVPWTSWAAGPGPPGGSRGGPKLWLRASWEGSCRDALSGLQRAAGALPPSAPPGPPRGAWWHSVHLKPLNGSNSSDHLLCAPIRIWALSRKGSSRRHRLGQLRRGPVASARGRQAGVGSLGVSAHRLVACPWATWASPRQGNGFQIPRSQRQVSPV